MYSFVRVADDYVDAAVADAEAFYALRRAWALSSANPSFDDRPAAEDTIQTRAVKNIVYVSRTYGFDPAWVEEFLDAMQSDLEGRRYQMLEDTLGYIYGSAEVIALMMCKIMNVNPAGYDSAVMLGRAMQYINFIRDIDEDAALGRCYFPASELRAFGLPSLERPAPEHMAAFEAFIRVQIGRYCEWQAEAEKGYRYLPKRLLAPVKTAADMYNWTALQIAADPHIVFTKKVKPTKRRVLRAGVQNMLRS